MATDKEFNTRFNLRESDVARASEISAAVTAAVRAAKDDDLNQFVHSEFSRRLDMLETGQITILKDLEKYNTIMNRWMGGFFVLTVVGAFFAWVLSGVLNVKSLFNH